MKNLILLLAAFLLLSITTSSCKKDWTCECSTLDGSDSVSFQLDGFRKNDANSKCREYGNVWGQCEIQEQN